MLFQSLIIDDYVTVGKASSNRFWLLIPVAFALSCIIVSVPGRAYAALIDNFPGETFL
ncbi:hypothetical protein [Kaarinaea lacus]